MMILWVFWPGSVTFAIPRESVERPGFFSDGMSSLGGDPDGPDHLEEGKHQATGGEEKSHLPPSQVHHSILEVFGAAEEAAEQPTPAGDGVQIEMVERNGLPDGDASEERSGNDRPLPRRFACLTLFSFDRPPDLDEPAAENHV
jgi:hypothetical protein